MSEYKGNRPRWPVQSHGNTVRFVDKLNLRAVRSAIYNIRDAQRKGHRDIILDFAKCTGAYPDGMTGMIAITDKLKLDDHNIDIVMPENENFNRLFINTNLAHHIRPDKYEERASAIDYHLNIKRYTSLDEQQKIVNELMGIVMGQLELDRQLLDGIEWSLNEITDNVLNHAESPTGGIVQLSTFREKGIVALAVVDAGRGILASMRDGHTQLSRDEQAIGEAVKAGVTRHPDAGQGNGLAGTLRVATLSGGSFVLYSGKADIFAKLDHSEVRKWPDCPFPGSLVQVSIQKNPQFELAKALNFGSYYDGEVVDIVDLIEVIPIYVMGCQGVK